MIVFAVSMVVFVGALLFAHATERRWLVWVSKPAAATTFVLAALSQRALDTVYGRAIFVALVLSWLGDVLLIPKDKRVFLVGILSFLAGHLAFGVAFWLRGVAVVPAIAAAVVLGVVGVPVGRWLVPQVSASLKRAVIAYMFVLSSMVALAAGTFGQWGGVALMVGAVCFYISDLSVALDRFVSPGLKNKIWGTPLYFGAQLLFASTVAIQT